MRINIDNGSTTIRNSPDHTPRCLDISTHLCGRKVKSSATHWAARDKAHKNGARDAYISVKVHAYEFSHEAPKEEQEPQSFNRKATEQVTYLDIEDARALRDALTVALDCADVK